MARVGIAWIFPKPDRHKVREIPQSETHFSGRLHVSLQRPTHLTKDTGKFTVGAFDIRNINQAETAYQKIKTLILQGSTNEYAIC